MKRRNADCGKLRRPIKRNKITEGMYGSTTVLYMKFLVLWAIVITADFMFMFRFEFLWPFWLLLRSVHDSFKYKGLAFSVLFVCIAITSDLVCLFFIPVHWLLFAASTYVWVQYVWHTDKGICLPTIILWMLFVYLEAGIRWKDSRHMPHLDLCRPFAAHCIGYPVVTLGFGFKSYVGYRMRQRKQREVAKENEFYMQLLHQALPQEETITVATATIEGTTPNVNVTSTLTTPIATTTQSSFLSPSSLSITTPSITTTTPTTAIFHSAQNSQINLSTVFTNGNMSPTTTSLPCTPNGTGIMNNLVTQNHHAHIHHHQQQQQQHQQQQNHLQQLQQQQTQHLQTHPQNHINSNQLNGTNSSSSNSISTTSTAGTTIFNTATTATTTTTTSLISSFNDDKDLDEISSNGVGGNNGGATANGHIGGNINAKTQRRSADKENKNRNGSSSSSANETDSKRSNSYMKNSNHLHLESNININNSNSNSISNNNNINNNNLCSNKDKSDLEHTVTTHNFKEKHEDLRDTTNSTRSNSNSSRKSNTQINSATTNLKVNENLLQGDIEGIVTVEPVERTKGRRNRSKKDNNASKDNHHHSNISNNINTNNNINNNHNNSITQNNSNINNNNNSNHQIHHHTNNHTTNQQTNNNSNNKEVAFTSTSSNNFDASSVSSATSSSSSSTSSASSAAAAISNIASKVVSKICESCLKFEADVKKYRSELSHMKQIENELRQKLESNLTTKSCLQAKHKECEDLEKRVLELTNLRHADYKAGERRLGEERRQKQSLEAQLNNEKKARKLAEEKAARPECSTQCKQRKQQIEDENKQLRRELKSTEEAKQLAEQNSRKWEQELRNFEAEVRNRDSNQQGTEMLMNALAAIQDKNCTLEKNLSAETRVKLDLFSALGDAKRQLEISESRRRSKEEEVLDLKAKIAQLLAVMPTDTLCLPACNATGAGVMLRMNDTPPLQTGPGPASPMLTLTAQATLPTVPTNRIVVPTSPPDYVQQATSEYVNQQQHQPHQSHQSQHLHQQQIHQQQLQHQHQHQQHQHQLQQQQQQQQQQCSGMVPVSVANAVLTVSGNNPGGGASNLDPNATVYTPKLVPNGPGGVVVVGGVNGDA